MSSSEFEEKTFELNKRLAQIVYKKPKKYRDSYGDYLIKLALSTLRELQVANSIYVSKDTPQKLREERFSRFKVAHLSILKRDLL